MVIVNYRIYVKKSTILCHCVVKLYNELDLLQHIGNVCSGT